MSKTNGLSCQTSSFTLKAPLWTGFCLDLSNIQSLRQCVLVRFRSGQLSARDENMTGLVRSTRVSHFTALTSHENSTVAQKHITGFRELLGDSSQIQTPGQCRQANLTGNCPSLSLRDPRPSFHSSAEWETHQRRNFGNRREKHNL